MQRGGFLSVPYWVLDDKNLNSCDVLVYSLIASYNKQRKDFYLPSYKIGEYIGKSERSGKTSIKHLLELNYIQEDTTKKYKSKCYKTRDF